MKILRYVLLFLLFAHSAFGATYYAATDGSGTTCGIATQCTLDYAVETKATNGDTVSINDGTYTIGQLVVPAGVSLTSTSQDNSLVILRPNADMSISVPFISIESASPGSAGSQTISYIEFDGINGANEARRGIEILNRSDVRIHHCNIHDFTGADYAIGVNVWSDQVPNTNSWWNYWPDDPQGLGVDTNINAVWPTNPVENFELDNNTITNCGYRVDITTPSTPLSGAVRPMNLKNSSIHDNTIDTTISYGQAITATGAFLWNVDIYDNDLTMTLYNMSARSSYIIELWGFRGGCEIHDNTANAAFSVIIGKETSVYDNTIIIDPSSSNGGGAAIEFLYQSEGAIYGNYISGARFGIKLGVTSANNGSKSRNNTIRNNVIYNTLWHPLSLQCYNCTNGELSGIDIYNNTINTNRDNQYTLIYLLQSSTCTLDDVNIKNNITVNGLAYAGKITGTTSNVAIDYNLFYNNGTDDWNGGTDTNSIIGSDPDFVGPVSTYLGHALNSGSSAIDAGIDVGLSYYGSAPDIGALEYEMFISNPSPPDDAENVALDVVITFTRASNDTSVDVWFDEGTCAAEGHTTKVLDDQDVSQYDPGGLTENTTYCWAVDENYVGGTETGIEYEFTTVGIPDPGFTLGGGYAVGGVSHGYMAGGTKGYTIGY